jgi:hypothetical protein
MPNLLVILSLISFLSIIIVIGSLLKSYTHFYENNNHIPLKLTPIYAQDNSGDFEDTNIFPDFKTEDKGGKEKDGGGDGGKEKDGGGDGGKEKDGGGDGGKEKDGGNEGRINENTNSFSPLSSGSPTDTDDKVNPYDEVRQPVGQQSEQEAEDSVQVDQQSGQQVDQQTISSEVNQTEQQQQDTDEQIEQQIIGTNQTEQQIIGTNQTEQQIIGNEVNQTEQQQVQIN